MKIRTLIGVVSALSMCLSFTLVGEEANTKTSRIRFSGIPAAGFGPDFGFGGGAVGTMYVDEEGFAPYKTAIGVKVFLTTKGMNSHHLQIDQVQAFGLPLRLIGRVGFYSTIAQNYCGIASEANCDDERANIEANKQKLVGSERDEFIHHYYQHRFMAPYGSLFMRWLLWQDVAKLELMGSYRGIYYMNRDFSQRGFYPGSLYERHFSDAKTEGYLSTLETGLMLDRRNNEPAPTSGYWLESTVRGGSSLFGSAWDYFGTNAAARFYLPLDDAHDLVIASQTIADIVWGDLPYDAMSRVGGSTALDNANAIGGQTIGRGIREQLYVGRIKAVEQLEARYRFWSFSLLAQNFDLIFAALGDFAMTSWDFSRFTRDMKNIYSGFGAGLRINWNKTFVIRADLGVSPSENFSPKVYLVVGNVF